MRQQLNVSQGRDQEQEEGGRQRRKMSKLDQESPESSSLEFSPQSGQLEEEEGEDDEHDGSKDIHPELWSELDSDEEIVICPQTNKFDRKRLSNAAPTQRRPGVMPSVRTECDQQGEGATTQLDDDDADHSFRSLHDDRRRSELLTQLATVTTTTLSPSPTPRPFRSPSPLSQSQEGAIDSTTITTTTTATTQSYSPDEDLPLDHREDRRPVLSRLNCQSSNNSVKVDRNDFDYLDALLDSINNGNFSKFLKLMDAKPKSDRNLFNVFIKGRTLLHHALTSGRGLEWCKLLVEKGADPNLSDTHGWHPLHLAAFVSAPVTSFIADCCEAVY